MLNRQLIYDDVITALIEQGEKSTEGPTCKYRLYQDDRVLKCGIGHIIPDHMYNSEIDESCVRAGHRDVRILIDPKYGQIDETGCPDDTEFVNEKIFLNRVQKDLHDELNDEMFLSDLRSAAKEFALEYDLIPYNFS